MVWNVGILVVGSLYWDPNREGWRCRRLTSDDGVLVRAPIRYGRKSSSRKNTYTMVFAPSLSAASHGTARIPRCRGPISTSEELIAEAKQLWIAENSPNWKPAADGLTLSAYWGCVALLAHPRFLTRPDITDAERENRQSLFPVWADVFRNEWEKRKELEQAKKLDKRREGKSPSAVYGSAGQATVKDDGTLQIDWPALADRSSQLEMFDLLLAIATTPTLDPQTGDYPSVEAVANAWKENEEQFRYFRCNREHQITTYQDARIQTLLPDLMEKPCL